VQPEDNLQARQAMPGNTCSGGQAVACALCINSKIMIFDELALALDPKLISEVVEVVDVME